MLPLHSLHSAAIANCVEVAVAVIAACLFIADDKAGAAVATTVVALLVSIEAAVIFRMRRAVIDADARQVQRVAAMQEEAEATANTPAPTTGSSPTQQGLSARHAASGSSKSVTTRGTSSVLIAGNGGHDSPLVVVPPMLHSRSSSSSNVAAGSGAVGRRGQSPRSRRNTSPSTGIAGGRRGSNQSDSAAARPISGGAAGSSGVAASSGAGSRRVVVASSLLEKGLHDSAESADEGTSPHALTRLRSIPGGSHDDEITVVESRPATPGKADGLRAGSIGSVRSGGGAGASLSAFPTSSKHSNPLESPPGFEMPRAVESPASHHLQHPQHQHSQQPSLTHSQQQYHLDDGPEELHLYSHDDVDAGARSASIIAVGAVVLAYVALAAVAAAELESPVLLCVALIGLLRVAGPHITSVGGTASVGLPVAAVCGLIAVAWAVAVALVTSLAPVASIASSVSSRDGAAVVALYSGGALLSAVVRLCGLAATAATSLDASNDLTALLDVVILATDGDQLEDAYDALPGIRHPGVRSTCVRLLKGIEAATAYVPSPLSAGGRLGGRTLRHVADGGDLLGSSASFIGTSLVNMRPPSAAGFSASQLFSVRRPSTGSIRRASAPATHAFLDIGPETQQPSHLMPHAGGRSSATASQIGPLHRRHTSLGGGGATQRRPSLSVMSASGMSVASVTTPNRSPPARNLMTTPPEPSRWVVLYAQVDTTATTSTSGGMGYGGVNDGGAEALDVAYSHFEDCVGAQGGSVLQGAANELVAVFAVVSDTQRASIAACRCAMEFMRRSSKDDASVRVAIAAGPGAFLRIGRGRLRSMRVTGQCVTSARLLLHVASELRHAALLVDGTVAADTLATHLSFPIDVIRAAQGHAAGGGASSSGAAPPVVVVFRIAATLHVQEGGGDAADEWMYHLQRVDAAIPKASWDFRKAFVKFASGAVDEAFEALQSLKDHDLAAPACTSHMLDRVAEVRDRSRAAVVEEGSTSVNQAMMGLANGTTTTASAASNLSAATVTQITIPTSVEGSVAKIGVPAYVVRAVRIA